MQQKLKKRMNKGALAVVMTAAAVLMATSVWAAPNARVGNYITNWSSYSGV